MILNIAIFFLGGDTTLAQFLDGKNLHISFIAELELLGYKHNSNKDQDRIREFIENCIVVDINNEIKEKVIYLRRKYNIKLPDAIVTATSLYLDCPFMNADRDFEKLKEITLILYKQ